MKKVYLLLFIFLSTIYLQKTASADEQQWTDRDFVRFNNRIGWQIFMQLANSEEGNISFSPYAFTSSLLQVYVNCTGEQRENIQEAFDFYPESEILLKSHSKVKRSFEISMTTPIFFQSKTTLPQGFSSFLKKEFDEYPQYADFKNARSAQAAINRVTSKKINTLDEDFFPKKNNPFETIKAPLLINAASFYTDWGGFVEYSRDRFGDKKEKDVKRKNATKMITARGRISYQEFDECKVLITENGNIQSGIILPDKDIPLSRMLDKMNSGSIESFSSRSSFMLVEITVPEIKLHFRTSLKDIIKSMGATSLFKANESDTNPFAFSDFIVFYTNQYQMPPKSRGGLLIPSKFVSVNRPFIYFTIDSKTGTLLFLGRFLAPEDD